MASAGNCEFSNIAINPLAADKYDIFQGGNGTVDVRFDNEKTAGKIEVFPDTPIYVSNSASGADCTIEGGVWVRKDVYLSRDNTVLMAHEFSGSNDFLNFYDTQSCRKLGQIDISSSNWTFDKGGISVVKQGTGSQKRSTKVYALEEYCDRAK